MLSKRIDFYLAFIIVCLAFFLRIWRLVDLFPFTMDEEYQALLARQIVAGRHFPLIGVNVADTGLYLGPAFTYLSAFFYWLFGPNPVWSGLASAAFGALTTLLLIEVGKTISKPVGLLAGLIYATSFLANAYDRKFWNPSLVPLLTVLLVLALTRLNKNPKWWVVIGVIFGLAFHLHYSLLILMPASLGLVWKLKIRVNWQDRWFRLGIVSLVFFLLPLVVFDLRHELINLKALVQLPGREFEGKTTTLERIKTGTESLGRFLIVPGRHDLADEIVLCDRTVKSSLVVPVGLLIFWGLWYLRRQHKAKNRLLFLLTAYIFTCFIFAWVLYPGQMKEYYFLPLIPLTYLILAWNFEELIRKINLSTKFCLIVLLVGLIIYNTWSVMTMKNSFGLAEKKRIIGFVKKQLGSKDYSLSSFGTCHKFEGYHYLFSVFYKEPAASDMDTYFSWIYRREEREGKPVAKVILQETDDEGVKILIR